MKVPYICLLSLMISVDSYAMDHEMRDVLDDSRRGPSVRTPSINGQGRISTTEQDLSVRPLMRAPAYASAADAFWNKKIDESITKKAILEQNNATANRELEKLISERKTHKQNLDNHFQILNQTSLYQQTDGCFSSPSDKRIAQMQRMQQNGIVVNSSLNAAGNFSLLGEQIKAKKKILTDSEAYINSLDPNFLSPGSRTAIAKFQQDHNDLDNIEQDLETTEGWSETMCVLNPLRYAGVAECFHPARVGEIDKLKGEGVPLRHRLHPTANLVRGEKIIEKADTVIWDAFLVEGHLKMDEISAEMDRLRAQFAALQQQIGTHNSPSPSCENSASLDRVCNKESASNESEITREIQ